MTAARITLTRPDDWHLHLRDHAALSTTVAHAAGSFARAIIMPNLKPPVTTVANARAYRERIIAALPQDAEFEPLMTLYLTDEISAAAVTAAAESEIVKAIKYYPAGATTNSESGVTRIEKVYPALERMQDIGMPLLIHGEVTDADIDIFDREQVFIDRTLLPLRRDFPGLKIVLEHITTRHAVEFVQSQEANLGATITPHHLLFNRNDMLVGGVRPHFYCLPILKRNSHQEALIDAATSGDPRFFLGTDSAPHRKNAKESDCGCAGIYSAPAALELYAEAFQTAAALERLEGFASHFGADFYGLPRNTQQITLIEEPWQMPQHYQFEGEVVIPIRATETVQWRVEGSGDIHE